MPTARGRSTRRSSTAPGWSGSAALGLVAKGALYASSACSRSQIPLGLGGKTTDRQGALRTVAQQPLGEVLLLALAVGLLGYAVWRFVQAFLDRDDEGTGPKGARQARRLPRARAALPRLGGGRARARRRRRLRAAATSRRRRRTCSSWPLGRWLVAAVGLGFLAAGVYNVYRSLTHEVPQAPARARDGAGRAAVGDRRRRGRPRRARGRLRARSAIFLVRAAWQYDPQEAIGIDGALRKLAEQPVRRAAARRGRGRACSPTPRSASCRPATARSEPRAAPPRRRQETPRGRAIVNARPVAAVSRRAGSENHAAGVKRSPARLSAGRAVPAYFGLTPGGKSSCAASA